MYDQIRAYFSRPEAVLSKIAGETGLTFTCRYRLDPSNPESAACAVGCLIPNDLYDEELDELEDGTGISDVIAACEWSEVCEAVYDFLNLSDERTQDFLMSAQDAHDHRDTKTPAQFVATLDVIAERYGLQVAA